RDVDRATAGMQAPGAFAQVDVGDQPQRRCRIAAAADLAEHARDAAQVDHAQFRNVQIELDIAPAVDDGEIEIHQHEGAERAHRTARAGADVDAAQLPLVPRTAQQAEIQSDHTEFVPGAVFLKGGIE